MKRFKLPMWTLPLLLLGAGFLSYGLLTAEVGLHWDDLPSIWFLHYWGPKIFPQAFAIDRPLQGWLFVLTTSIIGESQVGWHIFGIISRCLAGLALFWMLRLLWPKNSGQIAWISLLFVVYPGFTQQFISITYGHQFLILTVFFLSLGFMLLAWRKPAWAWPLTILSLALGTSTMLMLEYFVGLELLRPLLLWLVLQENNSEERLQLRRADLRRTGLRWLPYSAMLVFFVIWRLLNKTPRGDIIIFDRLRANPLLTLVELTGTVIQDLIEAGLLAWVKILDFSTLGEFVPAIILRYILLVLACAGLVFVTLSLLRQGSGQEQGRTTTARRSWARQALLVGGYALLISGAPVWVTNLHIDLSWPWNRFTIPMMIGAVILLVGLVESLTRKRVQSIIIVALLAGLAAGSHYQTAQRFRQDWLSQRDFFWQLVWRAPMIKPGTLLLTSELGLAYNSDNSLSSSLNWTYAPDNQARKMVYLLYDLEVRSGTGLTELQPDIIVHEPYRAVDFEGTTSQALVVLYQPPDCLKVIDPIFDRLLPDKPQHIREALALSDPDLIVTDAAASATPPSDLMGPEPKHGWCYYFQKAELARQNGDWEEIVSLGQIALKLDETFHKRSVAELVPYIEGYARSGRWPKALALTQRSFKESEENLLMLCDTWERLSEAAALDENGQITLESIRLELACPAP
ncbi:hypothetical protein ACFLZW_02390 [Chloroflexota bacterium]